MCWLKHCSMQIYFTLSHKVEFFRHQFGTARVKLCLLPVAWYELGICLCTLPCLLSLASVSRSKVDIAAPSGFLCDSVPSVVIRSLFHTALWEQGPNLCHAWLSLGRRENRLFDLVAPLRNDIARVKGHFAILSGIPRWATPMPCRKEENTASNTSVAGDKEPPKPQKVIHAHPHNNI